MGNDLCKKKIAGNMLSKQSTRNNNKLIWLTLIKLCLSAVLSVITASQLGGEWIWGWGGI